MSGAIDSKIYNKNPGWEFTKLRKQICKIFCNFKVLLQTSYPKKISSLCFLQ